MELIDQVSDIRNELNILKDKVNESHTAGIKRGFLVGSSIAFILSFIVFVLSYSFYLKTLEHEYQGITNLEKQFKADFKQMTDSMKLHNELIISSYGNKLSHNYIGK